VDQWRDFPLPDGSYSDGTRPFSQQDVCNYLPTYAEQSGTRSRIKYACAPGLATFATVGTGPHRGIHNCEGKLFVVSGESLYQVFVTGNSSLRGTIPGTAPVSMTHNQIDGGNELLIGTGDSSYVYNTKTGQLHQNDNVPLASVDFLNQLCLGVDVGRRFWRYSALADARTWNTLDNESAESSPDLIVGLKVSQGEVAVFGGRTIEIWANDPTQDTAFQRREVIERGCASAKSIQRLDNTLFWQGGDGIVYRLNGYQPVPISPKALTDEFLTCDLQNVRSYVYEDKGYVIYYLTFPDGRTWGYDVTAQKWHRRQSFGLDRWRLNTLVRWYDGWYGGDYSSGKIYRLTWGYVYEGCELMPRSIRTGVTHNNGNRTFLHGFRLNMQTGGQESALRGEEPPTISGNLPDGTIGDTFNYQYTITPGHSGQVVTLSVEGTFPTGLSIDSTGLVTGTLTSDGSFSWTITPSGECSSGPALADSLTGSPARLLATGSPINSISPRAALLESGAWSGIPHTSVDLEACAPAFGTDRTVLIAGAGAYYSDDLSTWTSVSVPSVSGNVTDADYGNGVFMACGTSGLLFRSADNGLTYSSITDTNKNASCIAYGNGKWILGLAGWNTNTFRYSVDDGLTFADGTVSIPYIVTCARYANGIWVLGGGTSLTTQPGTIRVSTNDASSFHGGTSSAPSRVQAVAYGNGTWVAVCAQGEIIYSTDGWNSFSVSSFSVAPSSKTNSQLAFDGSMFYLADDQGFSEAKTFRSTDGATWDEGILTGLANSLAISTSYRS
jgi:hypothetical protein